MAASEKINKWLEMAIITMAIFAPTAAVVYCFRLAQGAEFSQYYIVGRLIKAGAYNQIYNADTIQNMEKALSLAFVHGHSTFIVPPIISWTFYPLSLLGLKPALYLWIFILAASVLGSFFMLCRILGVKGVNRVWLAVLLGAMGPYALSMSEGYLIPLMLLALVGLFANLKKRNFLQASIYQSLFWLQPQLVPPLLCFELGMGQLYTVIITTLLAVIGLLVSFLIGGFGIVGAWYQLFHRHTHNWLACLADCTLQGQLLRFGISKDPAYGIAIAAYFVLLIAAFMIGKRIKAKQCQINILFTAIVPLSIVLSLRASSQELLLLFPGIVSLILMPINSWLKYVRALLIMVTLAILILPIDMLISCNATERSVFNPFFWLTIVFAVCALIIEKHSKGQSASGDV